MTDEIMSAVSGQVFGVWFLIGAALVFWMQAGFAMCEAGFTRAKNTGNILMKNLMDFCIGTVVFILVGFGLLLGEDIAGFIGRPGFDIFTDYANFDFSNFVFNLVFCATTATIVSGSMAERTKFLSYCVYSAVISAIVYPIEAHWTWGGGWLSQLGFHDFAGSNCIHMVGGIAALVGASILGARIGKFIKDKDGKVVKVNAFPGHNLPIACLGVFILWLGWYGFNGAACTDLSQLGSVFLTTTVSPALATVACMVFTWLKYGKPDVSMCLNASLAGLVAITAGCDVTDALGASIIGIVAGLLVCFGVWFLDYVLRVDDPVGAVAVHCLNGIWGTLAVGLFATNSAPAYSLADSTGAELTGLFYGGGFKLLGIQAIGVISTAAWTAVTMTIAFLIIKAVFGLRVSEEEEIVGLDSTEHGIPSAYAGFSIMDISNTMTMDVNENTSLGAEAYAEASEAKKAAAVPVVAPLTSATGINKVVIIAKLTRYDALKKAMNDLGVTGMTVTQVMGCGIQKGAGDRYRGVEMDATLLPKVKVEVVVSKIPVESVIEAAKKALYTGHIGDGKIFVYPVEKVVKIRTGEEDFDALQDVE
ncbi:ammonium transporter [Lacrimispora saccharolytica]|uniref:ammonium transporter n=1 Tax=Lacrimispora saccharolytica TaxID=84030 RepID=UPI001B5B6C3A|nr:ammonium transporter [Lacrimispora saccharolytica]MBP9001153.1 ammonium transporter [Lachnospiraceae bacterium]MCF2655910.1 ammonium transporter [Lacrimispora saccharolytica]MCI7557827.1 ammonium transporter [Lachnospiraceae bacterium]MDY4126243.1 ammonium transporter [Lachnospiraceae bacterium]